MADPRHEGPPLPGSAEHETAQIEKVSRTKQAGAPANTAQVTAARLAQVVNLHIAGFSLAEIGAAIGASADEVDRMLQQDVSRYVRTQPALRAYVRNWISAKQTKLLDAVWDQAVDPHHRQQLDYQDRALRLLNAMQKLHGAEAPVQAEIKVEAAPEAVDAIVQRLSAVQGLDYDADIFDGEIVDADLVHDAADQSQAALEVSGNAVDEPQPEDGEGLE